jgi:hypothetical protein
LDFSVFDMGFSFEEGFSRPDWKLVRQSIRSNFREEQWPQAWREAGIKWLAQLREDLGGSYRQYESRNFLLLCAASATKSEALLRLAEDTIDSLFAIVGPINQGRPVYGKHVILGFEEDDDYYSYISFYHFDGDHSLSAGCFISRGYSHIAFTFRGTQSAASVIPHELTHNYLCYLRLPTWLNEGLSCRVEAELNRRLGTSGVMPRNPVLTAELADEHHAHWNEKNIQEFWAGTSFYGPDEGNKLSYSLGEILVELLCENWGDFLDFVKNADDRDAGQDAALKCLDRSLGEVAGTFLGPGDWRPKRKTISELWEKRRKERAPQAGSQQRPH